MADHGDKKDARIRYLEKLIQENNGVIREKQLRLYVLEDIVEDQKEEIAALKERLAYLEELSDARARTAPQESHDL